MTSATLILFRARGPLRGRSVPRVSCQWNLGFANHRLLVHYRVIGPRRLNQTPLGGVDLIACVFGARLCGSGIHGHTAVLIYDGFRRWLG